MELAITVIAICVTYLALDKFVDRLCGNTYGSRG